MHGNRKRSCQAHYVNYPGCQRLFMHGFWFRSSHFLRPVIAKRAFSVDPTVFFGQKVAIIKTKSAAIAFFSSPPFLLLALSLFPFLFLRVCFLFLLMCLSVPPPPPTTSLPAICGTNYSTFVFLSKEWSCCRCCCLFVSVILEFLKLKKPAFWRLFFWNDCKFC